MGSWPALLSRLPYGKHTPFEPLSTTLPVAAISLITWSDPDDGLWTLSGAIERGITVLWPIMQAADTPDAPSARSSRIALPVVQARQEASKIHMSKMLAIFKLT